MQDQRIEDQEDDDAAGDRHGGAEQKADPGAERAKVRRAACGDSRWARPISGARNTAVYFDSTASPNENAVPASAFASPCWTVRTR